MSKYYNQIKDMVQDVFCVENNEIIEVTKYQTTFNWENKILIAEWADKINNFIVKDIAGAEIYRAWKHGKKYDIYADKRSEI